MTKKVPAERPLGSLTPHPARRIGDPNAPARRRWAPRMECPACGLGIHLSWEAYERWDGEPVLCFQCGP